MAEEDVGGHRPAGGVPDAVGTPTSTSSVEIPTGPRMRDFDRRLISQALTNIIKNATEGHRGRAGGPNVGEGRIARSATPPHRAMI